MPCEERSKKPSAAGQQTLFDGKPPNPFLPLRASPDSTTSRTKPSRMLLIKELEQVANVFSLQDIAERAGTVLRVQLPSQFRPEGRRVHPVRGVLRIRVPKRPGRRKHDVAAIDCVVIHIKYPTGPASRLKDVIGLTNMLIVNDNSPTHDVATEKRTGMIAFDGPTTYSRQEDGSIGASVCKQLLKIAIADFWCAESV